LAPSAALAVEILLRAQQLAGAKLGFPPGMVDSSLRLRQRLTGGRAGALFLLQRLARLRAIVRVAVERISDSCGFGVPLMEFVRERDAMDKWVEKKGLENLPAYRREKNTRSIDGLPTAEWD
jgi:hypothetical protein